MLASKKSSPSPLLKKVGRAQMVKILANNNDLPGEFEKLKKPTRYGYVVPDPKPNRINDLKSIAS